MYALTKDRYLNIIYSVGILYPGCSISVFQLSVQGKWKKDSPPRPPRLPPCQDPQLNSLCYNIVHRIGPHAGRLSCC